MKRLKRGSNEYGKRSRENSPKDNGNSRKHSSPTRLDRDKRHCDVLSDSAGGNKSNNYRKSPKSNGSARKTAASLPPGKRGKSRKSKSSDDITGRNGSFRTGHASDAYADRAYAHKMECDNCDTLDVRMIDYAHYCYDDGVLHPGPDRGFLFGLDNLIALLREMLAS